MLHQFRTPYNPNVETVTAYNARIRHQAEMLRMVKHGSNRIAPVLTQAEMGVTTPTASEAGEGASRGSPESIAFVDTPSKPDVDADTTTAAVALKPQGSIARETTSASLHIAKTHAVPAGGPSEACAVADITRALLHSELLRSVATVRRDAKADSRALTADEVTALIAGGNMGTPCCGPHTTTQGAVLTVLCHVQLLSQVSAMCACVAPTSTRQASEVATLMDKPYSAAHTVPWWSWRRA